MNNIIEFANRLGRLAIKLVLIAAAAAFVVSLLMATLVVMLIVTIWALLSGRKPEASRIFNQFRQTSARYAPGAWPQGRGGRLQDIVDVAAHEVPSSPPASSATNDPATGQSKDPMARMQH